MKTYTSLAFLATFASANIVINSKDANAAIQYLKGIKNEDSTADENRFGKCTCKNGSPIDTDCDLDKYNDGQNCDTCDQGFSLGNKKGRKLCYHNQCHCDNGEAWQTSVNQTCVNHGSKNECKSCDAGFTMGGKNGDRFCYHNHCNCENGEGVITKMHKSNTGEPEICENHGDAKCFACKRGYELIDFECIKMENPTSDEWRFGKCSCKNGSPIDTDCDLNKYNEGQNCGTCNTGFHQGGVPDRKQCYHNQCHCKNGEAWKTSVNQTCVNHGSENECKSCDAGFTMGGTNGDRVCHHNQCECENGEGVYTNLHRKSTMSSEREICDKHGDKKCFACDLGYKLVDSECVKIEDAKIEDAKIEDVKIEDVTTNSPSQEKCVFHQTHKYCDSNNKGTKRDYTNLDEPRLTSEYCKNECENDKKCELAFFFESDVANDDGVSRHCVHYRAGNYQRCAFDEAPKFDVAENYVFTFFGEQACDEQ